MLNMAMSHREDSLEPWEPLTCPALGDCGVPGILLAELVEEERGSEMFLYAHPVLSFLGPLAHLWPQILGTPW